MCQGLKLPPLRLKLRPQAYGGFAHLLRLAQEGGVKTTDAQAVLERMRTVAADLPRYAERWPVRGPTLAEVTRAVQSCARV